MVVMVVHYTSSLATWYTQVVKGTVTSLTCMVHPGSHGGLLHHAPGHMVPSGGQVVETVPYFGDHIGYHLELGYDYVYLHHF